MRNKLKALIMLGEGTKETLKIVVLIFSKSVTPRMMISKFLKQKPKIGGILRINHNRCLKNKDK